jgi:hypothetical protein
MGNQTLGHWSMGNIETEAMLSYHSSLAFTTTMRVPETVEELRQIDTWSAFAECTIGPETWPFAHLLECAERQWCWWRVAPIHDLMEAVHNLPLNDSTWPKLSNMIMDLVMLSNSEMHVYMPPEPHDDKKDAKKKKENNKKNQKNDGFFVRLPLP